MTSTPLKASCPNQSKPHDCSVSSNKLNYLDVCLHTIVKTKAKNIYPWDTLLLIHIKIIHTYNVVLVNVHMRLLAEAYRIFKSFCPPLWQQCPKVGTLQMIPLGARRLRPPSPETSPPVVKSCHGMGFSVQTRFIKSCCDAEVIRIFTFLLLHYEYLLWSM